MSFVSLRDCVRLMHLYVQPHTPTGKQSKHNKHNKHVIYAKHSKPDKSDKPAANISSVHLGNSNSGHSHPIANFI
jgi:hypothetical protein